MIATVAHPAVAGLILDIVGAIVIAVTVLVDRPAKWVADARAAASQAAMEGVFPRRDREHAVQVADTRIGATLLALGFAGQLVAGLRDDWPAGSALWAYPAVVAIVGLAVLYRPVVQQAIARSIYLERMRQALPAERHTTHDVYAREADHDGRSEIERWRRAAEDELGPLWPPEWRQPD